MDPLLQQFYDYIKEKYGIKNTEITETETLGTTSIYSSVKISVPGFTKNNDRHTWQIHLEGNKSSFSLVFGEYWPEENHSWSRYAEIEKYHAPSEATPYF